jgi:hypothetical protein
MCLAGASQSLLKASVHRAGMVAELSRLDNWGSPWVRARSENSLLESLFRPLDRARSQSRMPEWLAA